MFDHDVIRAHFFVSRGMKPDGSEYTDSRRLNPERLRQSEWLPEFERLMRNRLVIGAFRYGLNFVNLERKRQYDRVTSMIRRLEHYRQSGNTEHLVDVANLCMLEFGEGDHPLKHFAATDDGQHVENKGEIKA